MRTYRTLEYTHREEMPPELTTEVRCPDALVEEFLREYSDPGDTVVDPFAGFGTTLTVAEELDRIPYGLEYESDRVAHIQDRLSTGSTVRQGDVLELDPSWFPPSDCCFTSPPYMVRADDRNPFRNYDGESTYADYLDDMATAFDRLEGVLQPGAPVIVHVSNMTFEGEVTPLAWDVADRIAETLHFEGEVVIGWERPAADAPVDDCYGYGYDHSYCLVFSSEPER